MRFPNPPRAIIKVRSICSVVDAPVYLENVRWQKFTLHKCAEEYVVKEENGGRGTGKKKPGSFPRSRILLMSQQRFLSSSFFFREFFPPSPLRLLLTWRGAAAAAVFLPLLAPCVSSSPAGGGGESGPTTFEYSSRVKNRKKSPLPPPFPSLGSNMGGVGGTVMGGHSRENRQKYCCLQRTNRMQLLMSTDSPILPPC